MAGGGSSINSVTFTPIKTTFETSSGYENGGTITINCSGAPDSAVDITNATSSDSSIAEIFVNSLSRTVSGNNVTLEYKVWAKSPGTATLTAEAWDNVNLRYVTGTLEITVTAPAPVEDDKFLNKRGLTHFWENIDDIKQDKLTAGANITIAADNTISASQPTVNDATLTIQKNSTNVATFTANASSNVTANISVPTKTSELTNDSSFVTSSGTVAKADQLTTARTIAISGGAVGTATSFNGTSNISIPVTYVRDAYTIWGGKDIVADISPDDAGCIDEFGHNKLAFLPAECIEVKYSTDGGTTWTDYGLTDAQKVAMVTTTGPGVYAGKSATITADNIANMRGRVRIACGTMAKSSKIYTALKKILINFSASGATNTKIRMRRRTIANYLSGTETWEDLGTHKIGGWPGWNSYAYNGNFGGNMTNQTSQTGQIEFEFWGETFSSSYSSRCSLIDIRFIGITNWTTPSELSRAGHLYTMDVSKNATFPANVNVTGSLGHGSYTYTLPNKNGTVAMTSDIPSVPTVNNGQLTIQKNGSNVATFTANQSGNSTANISVPTKTSDLTNDGAGGGSPYVTEADIAPAELGGEGNAIYIEGATDCSTIDTAILGNIEQDSTPTPSAPVPVETVTGRQTVTVAGKNILDYVTYFRSGTYNGITATLNDDGSITISGKPTSNYVQIVSVHDITDLLEDGATYSLSSDGHDRRLIGQFQRRPKNGGGTQYIDTITGNKTVTIDKTNNNYFIGVMTVTTTDWGNDPLTITRTFQFEKGSATSFEPYKGQAHEINLGKNLIEPLMPTTTYNGVTCTNNGDGSFTLNGTATATATWRIEQSTGGGHDNLKPLNGTYTLSCKGVQAGVSLVVTQYNVWQIIGRVQNNETPSTFTTNLNDTLVYIAVTNGTTVNNVTIYPQLEKGNQATNYSAYFEPIELCKIGTHQDRIYKNGDKWYIEKQTGKAAIDTSAITQIGNYSNIEYATTAKPSDFAGYGNYQNIGVLCSHAAYQDGGDSAFWNQSSNAGHIYTRADSRVFWIGFAKGTGLNAMKTALANCTIYYPLATPTTTEITDETLIRQLEALAGALGYDGVTNIISTSPGLPAILSVSTYTGSAIPSATRARAGIVRIGDGIDVDDCGTISVNAQKAPTAFTMQYADNLAGWQSGDNYELVKETTGTPTDYIYRANKFYYGGADVSFLNEKTGVVFTPQELYAWLLDGNEAVLNHVPLGWALDNGAEVLYAGNYIDGIWLKREAIASQSGNMISFNGSAFVTALIPRTSSYEETAQDTLGIAISGYEDDGAMVYDLISIDGFSLYGSVQESSPII